MEINAKLLKFKSEVAPNIGSMNASSNKLTSDIQNFHHTNQHGYDEIKNNFNSQGMSSVTAEISYLNQVTTKVYESIGSELNNALSKCATLSSGIDELEKILKNYNDALSAYNAALKDENKTADKSAVTKYENEFKTKEEECLKQHDELMSLDASLTILAQFAPASSNGTEDTGSGTNTDVTSGLGFSGPYAKYIYEENGIIYQRVVPVFKGQMCDMGTSYTIVYDKAKMLAADSTAGQQIINWLTNQANGKNVGSKLYNYNNGKVTAASASGIGKVMDVVLNDTYKANNCKSMGDYSAIAAMVMGVGPINLQYGSSGKRGYTNGVEQLLTSGATLDCIGFVNWCWHQGLYKTGGADNTTTGSLMTPLNLLAHHSKSLATMSQQEKENLPVGTVLSKKTDGNYHVGIVIGYTTINGKKHVLVSQSSSHSMGGSIVWAYDVNTKFGNYDGGSNWMGATTPDMMQERMTKGSTSQTRVA